MVDEDGEQLFSNCKVCIICSKDLSQDTAQQVRALIELPFLRIAMNI